MPHVISDLNEIRAQVLAWRAAGQRVGLVPTMGALHAGHVSLVSASAAECDRTVATIFVNPMQFGPSEDFSRYPRNLDRDLELLAGTKTDVVFAPATDKMYAAGHASYVGVERVTERWEGAIRPTHFRGVATIVLKLFNIAPADIAYFGQKDYQQTVVIRRMVADLNVSIQIRVCPTVREPDGLAMSSRNVYLNPDERRRALVLPESLREAADAAAGGERDAAKIARQMRQRIESTAGVSLDYAAVVDPRTLEELTEITGGAIALVAARLGSTRLIDNMWLGIAGSGDGGPGSVKPAASPP